ncbi:ethylbenzene dehydrogenase-related protein, partial [Candidatus Moduliflexota bacterium]
KFPPPEIDGLAKEKSWKEAEPFQVGVKGASGRFDVTISALWGDGTVYFLVQWPDKNASVEHHPWRWSEETGEYVVDKAVEDALALQFSREGKLGDCMLSGRPVEADLWYWRAARTNPAGFADDETLTVSTKRIPKANFYQASNKMTVWVKEKRDAGTSPYRSQVAGTFEGETVRRYVARPPTKSAADIRARGIWEQGMWTVEFARKTDTGDPVDVVFAPGEDRYFSLAVFNGRERSEHSTSGERLLRLK